MAYSNDLVNESRAARTESIQKVWASGKWSDLTITCGRDTHYVHKLIVCSRSEFFDACFKHSMKEAETGIVDLPADRPHCVRRMLYYFYHDDYQPFQEPSPLENVPADNAIEEDFNWSSALGKKKKKKKIAWFNESEPASPEPEPAFPEPEPASPGPDPETKSANTFGLHDSQPSEPTQAQDADEDYPGNLTIHAGMYAIADKLGIPLLKKLALLKFQYEVKREWNTEDFLRATEEVFTSTPEDDRGLRDLVVQMIQEQPQLLMKSRMQDIIKRLNLSYELLMYLMLKNRMIPE